MSTEIKVEETDFVQLTSIESHCDSLRISNSLNVGIDDTVLIEHLSKVDGIGQIEHLIINYDSSLSNLNVLSAFPNLRTLSVYGQHMKTLEGIERFDKGEYISIETYRNKERDISQLCKAQVKSLNIMVERVKDLLAIAECQSLRKLDLTHSMEIDVTQWRNVPLEFIAFRKGKFKEIGNLAAIPHLKEIYVLGCRNLERFTGDNSNITNMIIDSCKKLDLRTLNTFKKIERLVVNSCSHEINLSELGRLQYVKHLSFILCNASVDLIQLKTYFPKLESLHISNMKKAYGMQLKEMNPDVKITSRSFTLE